MGLTFNHYLPLISAATAFSHREVKYLLSSYIDQPISAIRGYDSIPVQRATKGEPFNLMSPHGLSWGPGRAGPRGLKLEVWGSLFWPFWIPFLNSGNSPCLKSGRPASGLMNLAPGSTWGRTSVIPSFWDLLDHAGNKQERMRQGQFIVQDIENIAGL